MQKILELLASGECFKLENKLVSDVKKLSFSLKKDKIYQDNFTIRNISNQVIEGDIFSDNVRLKINDSHQKDTSFDVVFTIDTHNLQSGDDISGKITILSEIGEISVDFSYEIVDDEYEGIIKKLDSIIDYYDLTRRDFEKAFNIFSDKSILEAQFMQDIFFRSIYDSLLKGVTKEVAFIEFFKSAKLDVLNYIPDNEVLKSIYATDNIYSIEDIEEKSEDKEENITDTEREIIELIQKIQDKDLIDTLAIYCVRNDMRDRIAFTLYNKAVENGTTINKLYEILLLSLPERYNHRLPLYVYRFYYEDKSYTFEQKLNLYDNIINVFNENDSVYLMYKDEIREYTLSQIYQNKINDSLVKIYNNILSKDIINENNNKNIFYLLRCHKIIIKNSKIKNVIIKYKELNTETVYPVINNIAYVPIFFDTYIILFEDLYKNIFFEADIVINKLFDKKDLEVYCLENFPNDEILNISNVLKFLDKNKIDSNYEMTTVKSYLQLLNLNAIVKIKLIYIIIDYYYDHLNSISTFDFNSEYLLKLIDKNISQKYITKIVKIIMAKEDYSIVFSLLCDYSDDLLEDEELIFLYTNIIKSGIQVDKNCFNIYLYKLVERGKIDLTIIDYLVENFTGSIGHRINILKIAKNMNVNIDMFIHEIFKLMLSVNYDEELDYIYSLYNPNKFEYEEYNLESAYLTKKTIDYFLYEKELSKVIAYKLTDYLLYHMNDLDNTPFIYCLAFSKYVSEFDNLPNNDMRRVLLKVVDVLIKSDLTFAYYKKLNKYVKMPLDIMNKEYIEFRAEDNVIPKAILKINDKVNTKEVELTKVYMNIYVKAITVYKNEIINYEIYNSLNKEDGILKTGFLKYDDTYDLEYLENKTKNTFNYINSIIEYLDSKDIGKLKKVVVDMITKQEVSKNLFNAE